MTLKVTVELTGQTDRRTDMGMLFEQLSEVKHEGLGTKVFKNLRRGEFDGKGTFESNETLKATVAFFEAAFNKMNLQVIPKDKTLEDVLAAGTIEKRALGYRFVKVEEVATPTKP